MTKLNARLLIDEYAPKGGSWDSEVSWKKKDGTRIWIMLDAHTVKDPSGKIIYFEGFVRDITERKQVENEINMFAHAIRSTIECVSITDTDNNIIFVNDAFLKTYGYEKDELTGKPIALVHSHNNPPDVIEGIRSATLSGGWQGELMNQRKDGTEFPVFLSTSVVRDAKGESIALIGVATDITERKQAEEKIREQAALLDVAQDAIIVRDLEGALLFWNRGAERLYGWKVEEVLGKNAARFLYTKEGSQQRIEAEKSAFEKGEWTGELSQATRDGKEVVVESRWSVVRDGLGNPKSMLTVNTDITERKQLEAQFRHTQRLEIIGTLAGGIAHDLNNVLSPILMATEILREKLLDEKGQRTLRMIESAAKRGADIVKQVLTFARGVEGERVVLQPKHLLQEMEKIARETFPRTIQIYSEIEKDLWTIYGDATQLHQVLMNLCVNARDAMPNGGKLTIKAENVLLNGNGARVHLEAGTGPHVVLSVADTGTGIPREIIDKIFDPFFTTKEVGKGTGLGLSTVSGIVKSHAGFVNVDSQVGQGTEFKVYLPALETAVARRMDEASCESADRSW